MFRIWIFVWNILNIQQQQQKKYVFTCFLTGIGNGSDVCEWF